MVNSFKERAVASLQRLIVVAGFFLFISNSLLAQCPPAAPTLFGLSPNAGEAFIYCRNEGVGFGVFPSEIGQKYTFTVHQANGTGFKSKGGPLDGNGGNLSVATFMRTAQDAGEYRVTTSVAGCAQTSSTSFYAFYNSIDNLGITAWGGNAVSFRWQASGQRPAVTYEYAVSTLADPTAVPGGSIFATTDTFATRTGLTNGTTYYIHVRVREVIWNGSPVDVYFGCSVFDFPWQSIRFVACSASPTLGTITPNYAIACVGGNASFTATGGTSYQWYNENNTIIPGATSAIYSAGTPGQYRVWVTTGTTCQGMIKSGTLLTTSIVPGVYSGGGDFYSGDTVRLGISDTWPDQTYKILRNGVEVATLQGIGQDEFNSSEDTIWYKFAITSASQAGIYSVRVSNPYCTPIDYLIDTVNLVTSTVICPGAATSFNFSSVGANTNFQWQVDQGSGFVNISSGGVYSGATTKTLTISGASTAFYGYKYRCNATGATPVTSSTRTLKFGTTWMGDLTTVWNTAANWSCGVPTANMEVLIPAGRPRYPVLASNFSCKAVTINTGGSITINPGVTLNVTGQ